MTYRQQGAEAESAAPCYPSKRMLICGICSRFRSGYAMPAEQRLIVIVDASLFVRGSVCPMYEPSPVARPYCEPVEREEIAA